MDLNFYKEQLQAKEDMLDRTTRYLSEIHHSLEEKNRQLHEANHEIFESIKFAELIQSSLLPDDDILKIFFKDAAYSVMQQIGIGGDAVIIKNTSKGIVFGLMDSTGHGIPAAMLSISTCLMLNELTSAIDLESPNNLVKLLNYQLINTFNTQSKSVAHMEGTIFYFSSREQKLTYCSAKGKAMLLTSAGELIELKSGKRPVGESQLSDFENFDLPVSAGDKLFLYSDGLTDQFGGPNNKKFGRSRIKDLLVKNHQKSVSTLKELIIAEHKAWKSAVQQTDDISFLLIEF